jgi:Zn-dependent protease with chaperone function
LSVLPKVVAMKLMTRRSFSVQALALALACVMTLPTWAATPTVTPELPDPGSTSITKEQQEQLGLQATAEVYKQMPVLPDSSPLTQYVRQIGEKLRAVIPAQYSWPYQFHVIPQKEINAFALPGGPIFVNVGTIQSADNEAELVGVIAHEMSHVYMQHSAKQAPKQEWANIIGALGGLFGGSAVGNLARLGIQFGAGSLLLRYSRKDESQADAVGAIIMYKAGYNAQAMADFFEKLEKQGGGGGPQFLSDHPNPGNRTEAIQKEIQSWPPRQYLGNTTAFNSAHQQALATKTYTAQQIADGAKSGTWAQQNRQTGSIPANLPASSPTSDGGQGPANGQPGNGTLTNVSYEQVKPSGNFKEFQHDAFTIAYPDNWKAGADQNSVAIAPPAGVGQGGIAYGVVIGGAQAQNASSLDDATEALVQSLQQSNPGLQASGSPRSVKVNGVEGRSVSLTGKSPIVQNGRPTSEQDWLITVPRSQGGGLLYLVFIAPENDFSRLRSTYRKMLKSLQVR